MPWLWDSQTHSLPPLSPILPISSPNKSPSGRTGRHITGLCRSGVLSYVLFAIACLSTMYLGLVLWSARLTLSEQLGAGAPPLVPPGCPSVSSEPQVIPSAPQPVSPAPLQRKHDDDYLNLEELRDIVKKTNGYFVRDYSLWLGWNNVRYIIETAVLHAQLLNRTLIIPSFVYARSCQYDIAVCAEYATMVNKGDTFGWDSWQDLPIEKQMAWRIPITTMFNLTHLRRSHPVILTSEYLRLHNLSPDVEYSNGAWSRTSYHRHANVFETDLRKTLSLEVIENEWFDPQGINRVDVLPSDMKMRGNWSQEFGNHTNGHRGDWGTDVNTSVSCLLSDGMLEGQSVLSWERARAILLAAPHDTLIYWDVSSDEGLERVLRQNGWEVLYTYDGALGMEFAKHIARPIRQVAPRKSLRGFKEDFGHLTADVVLLTGEIHLYRKPGSVSFMTYQNRGGFSRIVLHQLRPIDKVLSLASQLDQRMLNINEGRMWMAAHMRRGDFVKAGWVMEETIETHLNRVKERFSHGRQILATMNYQDIKTYDVPDVTADLTMLQLNLPIEQDRFYIATDERDSGNLTYLADHGAVLVHDLLTKEDRRQFGWPLMITDVLSILEQATLAHSAYFYGHPMSLVAGGVINLRSARGADPRTALLD